MTIVTRNGVDAMFCDLGSASQIMGRGQHGSSFRTLGTSADGNNDPCSFMTEEDHVGWGQGGVNWDKAA